MKPEWWALALWICRFAFADIYTAENIHKGIRVPPYDASRKIYIGEVKLEPQPPASSSPETLSQDELVAKADAIMFASGAAADYSAAEKFYLAAVDSLPHGHAYFMLGVLASTGHFGETDPAPELAALYYQFGAANDDYNSQVALAYRQLNGIGHTANCAGAKVLYSAVSKRALRKYLANYKDTDPNEPPYNLRLCDFGGGLYGPRVSESGLSVATKADHFNNMRDLVAERATSDHDSSMIHYYTEAYIAKSGGYFQGRNFSLAAEFAKKCVASAHGVRGDKKSSLMSNVDRYALSLCEALLGQLHLRGWHFPKSYELAYKHLQRAIDLYPSRNTLYLMSQLHVLDPTSDGKLSSASVDYMMQAIHNLSAPAAFALAKYLIAPHDDFVTKYDDDLAVKLLQRAVYQEHYESMFYYADAMESRFLDKVHNADCSINVAYFKRFIEKSEFMFPHLERAFNFIRKGAYKPALVAYLMAAEQGFANAQVSAAFLLYRFELLLSPWLSKFLWLWTNEAPQPPLDVKRIALALSYFALASAQGDVDATIYLGDVYFRGIPEANISKDYDLAFAYYNKAALASSIHGHYKLGIMYEYGYGTANGAPDFYLAKRYYDLSLKTSNDLELGHSYDYPVTLALLRLRLKLLFSGVQKKDPRESTSWLGTLKRLGKSALNSAESKSTKETSDRAAAKAKAHHEGSSFDEDDGEMELLDYAVLGITVAIFVVVFFRNVQQQLRRPRVPQPDGQANAANAQVAGRNFELLFFAI